MSLTVSRFSYPWYLQSLSRVLEPLSRSPRIGGLVPEDLAASALQAAGEKRVTEAERHRLLGSEFPEAMRRLAQESFPALGKIHWRAALISAAKNRILLERYLEQGRPIASVEDPIFVCGLPRTGTSLVQRLIAQDPARRGLRTYELLQPIPPTRPSRFNDARRLMFSGLSSIVYRTFTPELLKIHYTSSTSLEECWMLFMPSYAVLNADYMFKSDQFGDWLLKERNMVPSYERYKMMLGILTNEAPDQKLVLKSPEHLWFLPELFEVFPNARVIWTHRDPAKAVPSYSAQISLLHRQHRGRVDTQNLGEKVMRRFSQGVQRGGDFCRQNQEARIAHLPYDELVADPIAALERCYSELGLRLTGSHRREMAQFMGTRHRDKHANRYRLDTFGLKRDTIHQHFAEYMQTYGLKPELPRATSVKQPASSNQRQATSVKQP